DQVELEHQVGVDSVGLVVYDTAGAVQDTVLLSVRRPNRVMLTRGGRPYAALGVPFSARPQFAVGPDGSIFSSDGATYRIAVLSPDGDTMRVFERDIEPPRVSDAERQAALEDLRQRIRRIGGQPPKDIDLPDHKPAIDGIQVDATGHIWVRAPMDAGWTRTEYGVFRPDGRYLGALSAPPVRIEQIGDSLVAGVAVDSLGVQRVEIMRLRKPAAH
ncbi:MAG TPA: hypothetical protein VJ957_09000, partial [Longimicrobiales bacterium]|nr:hypothetical protein [Longimicrobiales bacterium]